MPDRHSPFLVCALPRSRTFWMSRFFGYRGWTCWHDHAPFLRSVDDLKSWLILPDHGAVETAAALWWRLARHYRPDLRLAVVRRDRAEVIDSLMAFGIFDRAKLIPLLTRYERALDTLERAPGCLRLTYADLQDETACARLFEHCLQMPFDRAWWAWLASQNLQGNLTAQVAYMQANRPQIAATARLATQALRYACLVRETHPLPGPDGVAIREESLVDFWRDGQALMSEHSQAVGKGPDHYRNMNVPLWEATARAGCALFMIARLHGEMVGYLTAILFPSYEHRGPPEATQLSMFVRPGFPGLRLGMRLQRAAIAWARRRGARKMYMRAGILASGPALGVMYRRLGATDCGQFYELDLAA